MKHVRQAIMEILKNREKYWETYWHTSGEQGCRNDERTRFPPMWPGFESWRRRHMWVEFVVGSLLCSERFFSGYSGFPLSSKTNQPGKRKTKNHSVDVLPLNRYLFILHLVTKKKFLQRKSKETRQYRVFNKFEDLNDYFIYSYIFCHLGNF